MSPETSFQLTPECPRCHGKGTVKADGPRPRPESVPPLSDAQQARLGMWRLGVETCPDCGGSGEERRAAGAQASATAGMR
jgi:DnaJ-class molecular chaperone